MNGKKILIPLALAILAVFAWKLSPSKKSATPVAAAPAPSTNTEKAAEDRKPASAFAASPAALNMDQSTNVRSLKTMVNTLALANSADAKLRDVVEDLQKSGQAPKVIRDANPDTGEMIIVRTESPLPGTRYFHAQYFQNEAGERFPQHMSFEFMPGPDAMAQAVQAVEEKFAGQLSQKTHEREDYVRWKLGEDRIVWVKRLSAEDLADDPFNAYSKDDVGAVRVAVEADPHADGADD